MKKRIINKIVILIFSTLLYSPAIFCQLTDWENYSKIGRVYQLLDDDEYLWIATEGSLIKLIKETEEKIYYTRANGRIPFNETRGLTKDKDGHIWSTHALNGIGEFDGKEFKRHYTREENIAHANTIAIDEEGNKWIGRSGSLVKYDGTNWESWTTLYGLVSNYCIISALKFDRNGTLWIGGYDPEWKLAKFAGDKIDFFPDNNVRTRVSNIEEDDEGILWFSAGQELLKYDGEQFTSYDHTNTDALATVVNTNAIGTVIRDVKKDYSGNLWISSGDGLVKYNGEEFIRYSTPFTGEDFITSIAIDKENVIWLGTSKNDLYKFFNEEFKHIQINNSVLTTNTISFQMSIDPEHNIWFGTDDCLVKIDKDDNWSTHFHKVKEGYGFRVEDARIDPSGNLWIALGQTDTCLVVIDKKGEMTAFTTKDLPDWWFASSTKICFDKKGNTWITNEAGLYQYNGKKWTRYTPLNSPLESYHICDVAIDKDDNIWIGTAKQSRTGGGLYKFDGSSWEIYNKNNSGLPTDFVTVLKFDSEDNLWIHCRDEANVVGSPVGGGLTKFDGSTWTTYNRSNSDLESNTIMDIEIDKENHLWLATYGVLTKFDGVDKWETFNSWNSGLAYSYISKITLDYYRDRIWFNHLHGNGLSSAKLNSPINSLEEYYFNDPSPNHFQIYPNPAIDQININLDHLIEPKKIEIFNSAGSILYTLNIDSEDLFLYPISLRELNIREKGIYFLKITTTTTSYTQKFVLNN